jgi:hypothetical protein
MKTNDYRTNYFARDYYDYNAGKRDGGTTPSPPGGEALRLLLTFSEAPCL